jgi:hypothetical protein
MPPVRSGGQRASGRRKTNTVLHVRPGGGIPQTDRVSLCFYGLMTPLVMRRHVDYVRVTSMGCPAVR